MKINVVYYKLKKSTNCISDGAKNSKDRNNQ